MPPKKRQKQEKVEVVGVPLALQVFMQALGVDEHLQNSFPENYAPEIMALCATNKSFYAFCKLDECARLAWYRAQQSNQGGSCIVTCNAWGKCHLNPVKNKDWRDVKDRTMLSHGRRVKFQVAVTRDIIKEGRWLLNVNNIEWLRDAALLRAQNVICNSMILPERFNVHTMNVFLYRLQFDVKSLTNFFIPAPTWVKEGVRLKLKWKDNPKYEIIVQIRDIHKMDAFGWQRTTMVELNDGWPYSIEYDAVSGNFFHGSNMQVIPTFL